MDFTKSQTVKALALQEGLRVDNYELLSKIGAGGMGVVFKAKDIYLSRLVAIKFIITSSSAGSRMVERFYREAEVSANLNHDNIIKIYKVGMYNNSPYMVMEFIEGMALSEYCENNKISLNEKMEILIKTARALHLAHSHQIIHRDIKPANVMIRKDGTPIVMDFGIARLNRDSKSLTRTGEIMGSPKYMAPEQVEGRKREIGPHTDIYALGGVMYYLMLGKPPIEEESILKIMYRIVNVPPKQIRALDPDIPEALEEVCLTALEKKRKSPTICRNFCTTN